MPSILERSKEVTLIVPYILQVFPKVGRELAKWEAQAASIPVPELRRQALDSLTEKRFHCQGGSIYALYTPEHEDSLIRFIVALQTISDYLDNLCDRVTNPQEAGLRTLHHCMLAAVDHMEPWQDWYQDYPHQNDGGYLDQLVRCCRHSLSMLPGYESVRMQMRNLIQLYADLQVYKHLDTSIRKELLICWHAQQSEKYPQVYWWEFAAACGSTLAVFMLAALAAAGPVEHIAMEKLLSCYFPWVCGLHILLDYFIDLDEDKEHNDLNFVDFYPSLLTMQEGLLKFLRESIRKTAALPRASFHRVVTAGLLAMYLSDPKASQFGRKKISQQLLQCGGREAVMLHRICQYLRRKELL